MNILNALKNFFLAPTNIGDPELERDANTTHRVSIALLGLSALSIPFIFLLTSPIKENVLIGTGIGIFIWFYTIYLIKRGNLNTAKILILVVNTINLFSVIYLTGGLTSSVIFTTLFLLALANLLFPRRGAIIYGIVLLALASILYILSLVNLVPESTIDNSVRTIFFAFLFTLIAVSSILAIASSNYQSSFQEIRNNEKELRERNIELDKLKSTLELRVQERSAALEKRASQLQAVSSVARTIASVQDINTLLPDITKLVSQQFGFYHVGIFLIDEHSDYVVLRAANSEGGARMLERKHKLRLDSTSIVGYSTSRGEPRVALDVGADAVFFNNPDLPDTHSEMALPLRLGTRVTGSLDVQSTLSRAFTEEDVSALTTLADQIAIAIENARLFEESQVALNESRATFERYIKQEWNSFAQQARHKGFLYDGKQITPIDNEIWREKTRTIPKTGSLSLSKTSSTIAVPIKLRGQVIGMLDVRSKLGQREWSQEEITLLEAAAERAALALENARLVESAQRRAARERAIGDISTKIGSVSDLEAIMQTAVEELGRRISGVAEVTIEIDSNGNTGS